MATQSIRDILAANDFFRQFSDDALDFLAANATERQFETDEMIFCQGDRAEHFYLVLKGAVDVEVPALYGPTLIIQKLGTGMVLGWSWLIAPYEWDFQAQAKADTHAIEFDGKAILMRCEEDPAFGYGLLKRFTELMSGRLHAARRRMMEQWTPSGMA